MNALTQLATSNTFDSEINADAISVGIAGCYMGICDELNLEEKVNNIIKKNKHNVKISSGKLVISIIINFLCDCKYLGLSGVSKFVQNSPVAVMVGGEGCDIEAFNRYAYGRLLDAIAEYGATQFSTEILSSLFNNKSVFTMHLDATSRHLYKVIEDELSDISNQKFEDVVNKVCSKLGLSEENSSEVKETIATIIDSNKKKFKRWQADAKKVLVKRGYTRDHHPELGQICINMLTCRADNLLLALPAYQFVTSGNRNDRDVFAEIAQHHLPEVLQHYPNLKLIVADSAGSTAGFIIGCIKHNIHACVRLVDNYTKVKDLFKKVLNNELQLNTYKKQNSAGKTEEIELLEAGIYKFVDKTTGESAPTKMIICRSKNMAHKKTKTVHKRALKEKQQVQKALDKLINQPCACLADAQKAFIEATKKLKYVTVSEPVYEEVEGYKGKGRPKKDAIKTAIACKVHATAELNQAAIEEAIETEQLFVLATTDLEKAPLEVYEEYHKQSDIEGCWREIKSTNAYIDNFFLHNNKRIQALVALECIALAIARIFKSRIYASLKEKNVAMKCNSGNLTQTPSNDTLHQFFKSNSMTFLVTPQNVYSLGSDYSNSPLNLIVDAVGQHAKKYYQCDFYRKNHNQLLHFLKHMNIKSPNSIVPFK